jgi:hypothetical protein
MTKFFGIYPTDNQQSTKFLNKINTHLKNELGNKWHCYKIKFSDIDHKNCLNVAKDCSSKLVIFMGHGKSDVLYGSCTKESNDFISLDAIPFEDKYYKNENFINNENIGMLKNKIFFSFSCNSNRNEKNSLGRNAISKGVISFVGFGDIPTDFIIENNFPPKAIAVYKGIIVTIIKKSLSIAIKDNYSVAKLVDLIKIQTNIKILEFILNTNERHKDLIIENLFKFKNEIVVFGDRYTKLTN